MDAHSTAKRGVSLRALFPEAVFFGAEDIRVESCSCDLRSCQPGDLFVAYGPELDGSQDTAKLAAKRGAIGLLTEDEVRATDMPTCLVPDAVAAFGRLCQALAGNPSQRLKVIGICGTKGKTVINALVSSVLEAGGYPVGTLSALGYSDGLELQPATWRTPPAPLLATLLARIEANGCSHAVMDVSAEAIQEARVAGVNFDMICAGSLSQNLLEINLLEKNLLHTGLPTARHAESDRDLHELNLFEQLAPEGVAIINSDDPACVEAVEHLDGPNLTIAIDDAAAITATIIEQSISEQTFLLGLGWETVPVRTTLVGRQNVYNCLVAAAVGFTYGVDVAAIVRGLERVKAVPGRLERLECGQPFGVFVDVAQSPAALSAAIDDLRDVTDGRVICVFGATAETDRRTRFLMGQIAAKNADLAVVTSDNPGHEDPNSIIEDIVAGSRMRPHVQIIPERADAIGWVLSQAMPGDCVLIAGKGDEDYQLVGDDRRYFDDREFARRWLYWGGEAKQIKRASA